MIASAWRSDSNRPITSFGVHPELDDLQCDAAADRMLLLGEVDDSHPALAKFLEDPVASDAFGHSRGVARGGGGLLRRVPGVHDPRTTLEYSGRVGIVFEDLLDFLAKLGVILAGVVQICLPLALRKVSGLEK